jgi:Ca-activated chloride channel family protein
MTFTFHNPEWLVIMIITLPWFYSVLSKKNKIKEPALVYSDVSKLKKIKPTFRVKLRQNLYLVKLMLIITLFTAMARPQLGYSEDQILTEGVDILLGLDISGSMLAEDLEEKKTRLDAAKEVIAEFITARKNDRIGLVVFAGAAFTQCPLTLDYSVLKNFLERAKVGLVKDGTAIGSAIATSVNRLKKSKAESRVLILLTDGQNNAGRIDPRTAGKMAKALGIKIYTIGAGTRGLAPIAVDDPVFGRRYTRMRVDIDEELLTEIADMTGGKYYRAQDKPALQRIYDEINKLEKTEIKVKNYTRYRELAQYLMYLAFILLGLEILLKNLVLRSLP